MDYRIFGFTVNGDVRANLYNQGGCYDGALYSWVTAKTFGHLAYKLEHRWEQPLSDAEWEAIDEQELTRAEVCETCGGSGADPGSLNPDGEPCPECSGSREPSTITHQDAFAVLRRSMTIAIPEQPKEAA